jgi:hypothetical protein
MQVERPEVVRMLIGVPVDIRDWIEREAEREERTLTSVIIRALRAARMDQERREKAVG